MILITDIIEREDHIEIRASLDTRMLGGGYIIPKSPLVPQRLWGCKVDTKLISYNINK